MPLASTPYIYWYPDSAGTLETIDLGALSDLRIVHDRARVDAQGVTGRIVSQDYGGRTLVGITREVIAATETALIRDLTALEVHLRRGGLVGFALRQDKAWAAWSTATIQRGATSARHSGNGFYEPSATLASGDEVVIRSANPERAEEIVTVSAVSSLSATFSETPRFTYLRTPILLRHRDYYPVLRLDPASLDRPMLTHQQRIVWSLNLDLVEDPEALDALSVRGGSALRNNLNPGSPSLPQAVPPRPISPGIAPTRPGGAFGSNK